MADAHLAVRGGIERSFNTVTTPFRPFSDAGELLYSGPWVAERLAEFGSFLADHFDDVLPVVATIIGGGDRFDAVDVFRAQYRLAELKLVVAQLFTGMEVLVLPTIGTTFTVSEVLADPIATNTVLGRYSPGGQRPRLRVPRCRGRHGELLPGVQGAGAGDDRGAGRDRRLACAVGGAAAGDRGCRGGARRLSRAAAALAAWPDADGTLGRCPSCPTSASTSSA